MNASLELEGVRKTFGGVHALRDVTLAVPAGGVYGLLGPNGAGKTTLLSLAAGFLRPDAGHVSVLGVEATDFSRLCGRVSLLPQDASFQPGVTLGAQLAHFARLSGMQRSEAEAATGRALEQVRLSDVARRAPGTLSHGMCKRAALAQALLGEPDLVFLDEPTAGLDPENARHVRDLVASLGDRRTVVLCSHNLHEIQELCDGVAILRRGEVVEAGPMSQFTADVLQVRITLHGSDAEQAATALRESSGVEAVLCSDERTLDVHLHSDAASDRSGAIRSLLGRLLDGDWVPSGLRSGASLESRYLEITADDDEGEA